MKIYILTFHCAYNVGAMLQAYALATAVKRAGYTVEIIDYRDSKVRHKGIDARSELNSISRIKKFSSDFVHYCYRTIKYLPFKNKHHLITFGDTLDSFSRFMQKKLPLTAQTFSSINDLKNFSQEDAVFIVGSDQVWNPALSENPEVYLLNFVETGVKNSYAASFGKMCVELDYKSMLNKHLEKFSKISVRESSGVDIVENCSTKKAVHVLDPVYLLGQLEWKDLTYRVRIHEPYIFVYCMESNPVIAQKIEELKRDNPNLKVARFDNRNDGLHVDYHIPLNGPVDFLSYLFYSEYVVTNSFHGASFSIIFNKCGYVVPHSIYNERVSSLMKLVDCQIDSGAYHLEGNEWKNLESMIKCSKDFLQSICEK